MRCEPSTTNFLTQVYFKNSNDVTSFTGVFRINEGLKLETLSVVHTSAQFMLKKLLTQKKDKTLIQSKWLLIKKKSLIQNKWFLTVEGLLTGIWRVFTPHTPLNYILKVVVKSSSFFFFL